MGTICHTVSGLALSLASLTLPAHAASSGSPAESDGPPSLSPTTLPVRVSSIDTAHIIGVLKQIPGISGADVARRVFQDGTAEIYLRIRPEKADGSTDSSAALIFRYEFDKADAADAFVQALRDAGINANSRELVEILNDLKRGFLATELKRFVKPEATTTRRVFTWSLENFDKLIFIGLLGVCAGFGYSIYRQTRGESSSEKMVERPKERFTDVGGCPHLIDEIKDLNSDVQRYLKGESVDLPRGILFEGGPGLGKTLLAKAMAGELELPFITIDGSAVSASPYLGVPILRLRSALKSAGAERDKASKSNPHKRGVVIVFIDEIESLLGRRGYDSVNTVAERQNNSIVNLMLQHMDGVKKSTSEGIIIVGATNHAESIDEALLRPGRFQKVLRFDLPQTVDQRIDILERLNDFQLRRYGYKLADPGVIQQLAQMTPHATGDVLRSILSEAKLFANRRASFEVTTEDIYEAFQRRILGRAQPELLGAEFINRIAFHECGHALVALACGVDISLISATPRGGTGGRVVPNLSQIKVQGPLFTVPDMRRYALILSAGGEAEKLLPDTESFESSGVGQDRHQVRHALVRAAFCGIVPSLAHLSIDMRGETPAPVVRWMRNEVPKLLAWSRSVLDVYGADLVTQVATDLVKLNRDLYGREATDFFLTRIPSDRLAAAQARVKQLTSTAHDSDVTYTEGPGQAA